MPPRPRSRKARIADLRGQLQAQGQDMAEIAQHVARDEKINLRAAWRLAHGLSQQEVADRYNAQFPPGSDAALITAKQVSYWETWPHSGREPSLTTLGRLARIYGCTIIHLIADYENPHDDAYEADATGQDAALPASHQAYQHADPSRSAGSGRGEGLATTAELHPAGDFARRPTGVPVHLLRLGEPNTSRALGQQPAQVSQVMDDGRKGDHPADIRSLVDWVASSNTTDDAIQQIERAAAYLAEVHSLMPPQGVLAGVLQVHHGVRHCLQDGRQRLRQMRELLRIDSRLLAHACLLLGDLGLDPEAAEYGKASLILAQEAGASEARAWAVQAKTARWQGKYVESAELARRGFEASALSPVKAELAYREANAIALFGDATRACQALQRAQRVTEALPSGCGPPGSVWSFPVGRQAVFALSVAIHTGDPDGALRAAAVADAGWARGEPKITANWAQIQAGVSIAYLMKGSLDAAAHHIAPVLDLPEDLRISTVTGYIRNLDGLLAQHRFTGSRTATRLRHEVRDFLSSFPVGTGVTENR